LKSIERLIKMQIPRASADDFVPPDVIPADAPRPPRPQHGQRRHSNTTAKTGGSAAPRGNTANGNRADNPQKPAQPNRNGQPRNSQSRDGQPRNGQPRAEQTGNAQPGNKPRPPKKPAEPKFLSEAARHQAMPQPALFSPKPAARRGR
ncbi:MAG: RNA helicase, partial [Gallionella sp.]|nr:RNA helicase [Gallionella sp.]